MARSRHTLRRLSPRPVRTLRHSLASTQSRRWCGLLFAGSPDTVYQQMDFYDKVGGFGHLVMIGRSGFMTHAEAEKSIKLFAQEVLPRLKEIAPVTVG